MRRATTADSELDSVFEAWRVSTQRSSSCVAAKLSAGASDAELDSTEAKLGRKLPESLRTVYRRSNGASLLGGNLHVLTLGTGNDMGLTAYSDFLRRYGWPIPDELLVFGDNGSDELYRIWCPRGAPSDAPAPVICVGEIFEPGSFTINGTCLTKFLLSESAFCLMYDDEPCPALDVLGLPMSIRDGQRDSDEALAACFEWADPGLPHIPPDPYEQRLTREDIVRFVESRA